jgi:hypothetical protein
MPARRAAGSLLTKTLAAPVAHGVREGGSALGRNSRPTGVYFAWFSTDSRFGSSSRGNDSITFAKTTCSFFHALVYSALDGSIDLDNMAVEANIP